MSVRIESAEELSDLLRAAEAAHGQYEQQLGHADANWPAWYARYIYVRLSPADEYVDEPERLSSIEPFLSQ